MIHNKNIMSKRTVDLLSNFEKNTNIKIDISGKIRLMSKTEQIILLEQIYMYADFLSRKKESEDIHYLRTIVTISKGIEVDFYSENGTINLSFT